LAINCVANSAGGSRRREKTEGSKLRKQTRVKEKVKDAKLTSSDPLYVASNMK